MSESSDASGIYRPTADAGYYSAETIQGRFDKTFNDLELVHRLWDVANAVHSYGPLMILAALRELGKTHDIIERKA